MSFDCENSRNSFSMIRNLFFIPLFTTFLILFSTLGFAQDVTPTKADSALLEKVLSIDQISGETEILRTRISSLEKVLRPSTRTHEIDSILDTAYIEILVTKDSLYAQIDELSRRDLTAKKVTWKTYKSELKSLQTVLNDRTNDITEVSDELVDELEKWTLTKNNLLENSGSEDVFSSLDTMILTLNSLIDLAHVRVDSVFSIQKRLTELILVVDEASSEINRVERQIQKNYFILDSDPLWSLSEPDSTTLDSAQVELEIKENKLITGIAKDLEQLQLFGSVNLNTIVFQIGFLLFFLVIIVLMRKRWKIIGTDINNPLDIQTKIVFDNPIWSVLVVGILISVNFYEALIPIYVEVHMLVILIATIVLLPKITTKRIRIFLMVLFVSYLIEITDVYFEPRSVMVRWALIFESVLLFFGLNFGQKVVLKFKVEFQKIATIFRFVIPVYQALLVFALILNVIGMVNLSSMLVYGVMSSVALGMVISLAIKVTTSFMVLFFKLRKAKSVQALSLMVEATNQRFQPALVWIGVMLWVLFTLKGFDVYSNILEWVYGLLDVTWDLGDMKISLGSILSFIILFVITLLFAKLLATIFQDEWMIQTLPRGVAPAISLLLRITIISIGLYLAFTSAGFDLSKMGFIFGALGVGIGFGLQNVVLNFIAGLILAFERPINLGDAIEVDNETGVVTSIGVRSSNIRTWSGAEAIIPNGDLISKKVINWTLTDRNRRSKILMRTAPNADPDEVVELFNEIAASREVVFKDPAPKTYFYGYDELGNLSFALMYWTSFSDTLKTDSAIAMQIFKTLKERGIDPPMPNQRNFD